MTFIDSDTQMTTINNGFYEEYGLKIHPLGKLLHIMGTGGFSVPYLGYVKEN